MNFLSQKAQDISSPVLILFALSIPLSTSASSILGILLILIWLAHGDKKKQLSEIFHNPTAIAVLLYLALHIIGLLWTEDLEWGISMVKKQWKLLLFPLFFSLLRKEHINFYMAAFIAAIVIKASKAYLVWLGFSPPLAQHMSFTIPCWSWQFTSYCRIFFFKPIAFP